MHSLDVLKCKMFMLIGWSVIMHMHSTVNMWKSDDNLRELVLSFYYDGPWNWTQIISLGKKCILSLSHFSSCLFVCDRVSSSSGWPWTSGPLVSTSRVLALQVCTTPLSLLAAPGMRLIYLIPSSISMPRRRQWMEHEVCLWLGCVSWGCAANDCGVEVRRVR